MKALTYLFFVKIKAGIRNTFSKWSSGLLTAVALLFFVGMAVLIFTSKDVLQSQMVSHAMNIEGMLTMFCGYVLFFLSIMVFQKRTAIVTSNDANYIFAGPFSKRMILGYLLVDTLKGTFIFAFFSAMYLLFMMSAYSLTVTFVLMLLFGSFIMFYFTFVMITFFYFWEMDSPIAKKIKYLFFACVLLFVGALILISVAQTGWSLESGIKRFISDPLFYWTPVIGWVKYGLMSQVEGNTIGVLIGFGSSLLACLAFTFLTLNIKGDFYEQAIQDAEWVTNLKKRAKENPADVRGNQKVKEGIVVHYKTGAAAIWSKELLIMKKTNTFINKQVLLMLLMYLAIAYFMGRDFMFYQFFILIVVMTGVTTDSTVQELKIPYIYLLPDIALNKMIYLILPQVFRMVIILLFAFVPCLFLFNTSILDVLIAFLQSLGFAMIFIAGNLWSIRILKQNSNAVTEQFIKMGLMMAAMIPSIVVMVIVLMATSNLMLASLVNTVINLVLGVLFIYLCKSMLNGVNIMAE